MNDRNQGCSEYRELMHEVLDGDLMDASRRAALDDHLEGCEACREAMAELRQVQAVLQSAPARQLPDEWLDQVFAETSRAPRRSARGGYWTLGWRAAAAAAVLAAALWGFWPSGGDPATYTQAELEQAAADARLALKLTADALDRTERIGIERVIEGEVTPALQRVPVRLPAAQGAGNRKS